MLLNGSEYAKASTRKTHDTTSEIVVCTVTPATTVRKYLHTCIYYYDVTWLSFRFNFLPVILFSNTSVQPFTVMIESLHTFIAITTMFAVFKHIFFAEIAIHSLVTKMIDRWWHIYFGFRHSRHFAANSSCWSFRAFWCNRLGNRFPTKETKTYSITFIWISNLCNFWLHGIIDRVDCAC